MALFRLAPEMRLPPYSYVTGRWPHPLRDPTGHSFGMVEERPASFEPASWSECRTYLHAIDLFNHGYYWEAHEAWESLWHAVGRSGTAADFLKGLIKLAAAGVKVREERPDGVQRHARRAIELFQSVQLASDGDRYCGLMFAELIAFAESIADAPPPAKDPAAAVEIVFNFLLQPTA